MCTVSTKASISANASMASMFSTILCLLIFFPLLQIYGQHEDPLRFPVKHSSSKLETNRPVYNNDVATLNQSTGEYFALMKLGTPATEIAVILDTGSELVWVQCQPCLQCQEQAIDPIFNPANSSTFRNISCHDSDLCVEKPNDGVTVSCNKADACLFTSAYVDNSSSSGYMAQDTLRLSTASVTDFLFGCANYATGSNLNASGTMGLDRGSNSAVSQLGAKTFSYCFPDRTENLNAEGFISFGGKVNDSGNMRYAKLIQNEISTGYSQFYYVNLTGISVGGELLDIPESSLELNESSGYGGTIVDSGTTLTYLVSGAFKSLMEGFNSQVRGNAVRVKIEGDAALELCYLIIDGSLLVPNVTFHFDGSVDLNLPVNNIVTEVAPNTYCLAFANAGRVQVAGSMNIIGNIQQQNVFLQFNLESSQLGFEVTNCSALAMATGNNFTITTTQSTIMNSPNNPSVVYSPSSNAAVSKFSEHLIAAIAAQSLAFSFLLLFL